MTPQSIRWGRAGVFSVMAVEPLFLSEELRPEAGCDERYDLCGANGGALLDVCGFAGEAEGEFNRARQALEQGGGDRRVAVGPAQVFGRAALISSDS